MSQIPRVRNPDFNSIEFDGIKKQVGLNRFILTLKQWSDLTESHSFLPHKF